MQSIKYRIAPVILLLSSCSTWASDNQELFHDNAFRLHKPHASFNHEVTQDEYLEAYRSNRELLADSPWSFSRNIANSLGIPERGLKILDLAAQISHGNKTRGALKSRKSVALETSDIDFK